MTETKHTYQAMFLLDNQEVRKGYAEARDWVRSTLEKHGAEVSVLRLWAEQELAYPIGGRHRATYLLGWISGTGQSVNEAKREMYLVGPVFRVLFLKAESIPEEELAYGIQDLEEGELVIPEDLPEEEEEEVYAEDLEPNVAEGEGAAEEDSSEEVAEPETSTEPTEETQEASAKSDGTKASEEEPGEDVKPQEEASNV